MPFWGGLAALVVAFIVIVLGAQITTMAKRSGRRAR
jgi:hypothetical protein